MKAAVVDVSVALKWVVDEKFSEHAGALLTGRTLCAPAHWRAEAVDAIWGQVYRSKLSAEDARQRASTLITVYDSLCVALAKARRIPLVSDDRRLLRRMIPWCPR